MRSVLFSAAFAAAASLCLSAAQGAGIGAKYGSREPHTCPSRTAPASGLLTAAQATQYLRCDEEKESASVTGGNAVSLLTEVSLQVGAPRPFLMGSDNTGDNVDDGIDPHFPVYPVRGSFVHWTCWEIGSSEPAGKNCLRQAMPHATGICFMSSFKEWHCHMQDISQPGQNNQPAPKTD